MLRVLQQPDATGGYFQELLLKGVPPELVETVKYTGPGYAIFMQGSKVSGHAYFDFISFNTRIKSTPNK